MAADLELLSYLLLLLVLAISLLWFKCKRSAGTRQLHLPPAPWALPVIGHLHHLAGALPHHALRGLARRHGPLMLLRLGELEVLVASSPAAAREIMKTQDATFASRTVTSMLQLAYRGAEGVVFAPYGDGWRQLRKICTQELLSAGRVQSFRAVREEELGGLLCAVADAASSFSPVNLDERLSAYVAESTVRAIIGSQFRQRETYLQMLQDSLKIVPGMTLPDLFPSSRLVLLLSSVPRRMEYNRQRMNCLMDTIIQEHHQEAGRKDKDKDLLDVLLRLQKEAMGSSQSPLTTENINIVLMDLFGAGSETSATVLQWAMAELMRNPRVMRKVQDEVGRALAGHDKVTEATLPGLHYMRLVIKETLRLHPPSPLLLPRRCGGTRTQVLGFDVPEGAMVIVNAWMIGRDPAYWDDPDEFSPERFDQNGRDFKGVDFEFIPFGAGRRICPGMAFGLAHIHLALAAMVYHFDWKMPDGMEPKDLDMTESFGITTQRKSKLVLVPVPRVPVLAQ
uniref:Uncharacterized protein n=1 Tax=Avena sativa TaxID=4498 RepID=A0ACD5ZNV2_AVESA